MKPQKASGLPAAKMLVALTGGEHQASTAAEATLANVSLPNGALFFKA